MNILLKLMIVAVATLTCASMGVAKQETIKTRVGELNFTHDFINGYPTEKTEKLLFNEIDFQRACQAYLWALPIVSMEQWRWSHENQLGAKNGQAVWGNGIISRGCASGLSW